jgi:hypothetical protein
MKTFFHVDKLKVSEATKHYLVGLFDSQFFNKRFQNYCGTVEINYEKHQILNYLVLYDDGVYEVFIS